MLLVTNGRVITRDADNAYLENGAVAIDGEKIAEVGEATALAEKYPEAEVVDAHGGVIMPGLVNCHTHIYSGLARGLSIKGCNPTNFLENLEQQWWKIDDNLTLDGTRASATRASARSRAPSLRSRTSARRRASARACVTRPPTAAATRSATSPLLRTPSSRSGPPSRTPA